MRRLFFDIECYYEFFCVCVLMDDGQKFLFIIDGQRNDRLEMYKFWLAHRDSHEWVGFNSQHYDNIMYDYCMRDEKITNAKLKRKSDDIISGKSYLTKLVKREFDIMGAMNFRRTFVSLKTCAFHLGMNVQELPFKPNHRGFTQQDKDVIIKYCFNDVSLTQKLFHDPQIVKAYQFREDISKEYGIDAMSMPEQTISSTMLENELIQGGIPRHQLYDTQDTIKLWEGKEIFANSVVFDFFKTLPNALKGTRRIVDHFKALSLNVTDDRKITKTRKFTRNQFSYQLDDMECVFGRGGVHGFYKKGWFKSKQNKLILSSDVSSYYPNLIVNNKLVASHIKSPLFFDKYHSMYTKRQTIPKSDRANYILKIMLNAVFGNSNNKYSYLYDPFVFYSTTVNGQLYLVHLYELIANEFHTTGLMLNTDGLEIIINESDLDHVLALMHTWEGTVNLKLETVPCEYVFAKNVNNYIAQAVNKPPKVNGSSFNIPPFPFDKNPSGNIVSIAIYEYVVNGKPIRDTIMGHPDMNDFAFRARCIGDAYFCTHTDEFSPKPDSDVKLSGLERYIVGSRSGHPPTYLYKYTSSGANKGRVDRVLPYTKSVLVGKYKNGNDKYSNFQSSTEVVVCSNPEIYPEIIINYDFYIEKANETLAEINMHEYT